MSEHSVAERRAQLHALLKRIEAWTPQDWPFGDSNYALEDDVMAATLVHCKEQSFRGFKMYWVGEGTTNSLSLSTRFEGVVALLNERLPGEPVSLRRGPSGIWEATVCSETAEHASPHLALLAAIMKALIVEAGRG
ncbi:MAG: hypothetical protein C4523_10650 [Myxococcales bacterium]|nr:MAG: hypothetical protein C4523_10650 [Myxococcales bacterium]